MVNATFLGIIPLNTLYRVLYSLQEPTLPVYLQRTWQLNSSQVGMVFFSAALPAMLGQSQQSHATDSTYNTYHLTQLLQWLVG